jgi:hypothetical protein
MCMPCSDLWMPCPLVLLLMMPPLLLLTILHADRCSAAAAKLILMTDVPGVLKDKDDVSTCADAVAAVAAAAAAAPASSCHVACRSLQRCRQRS